MYGHMYAHMYAHMYGHMHGHMYGHICMGICVRTVWLRGVEFRALGRGVVQGGVVKMQVYTELWKSMTAPSPRCAPNIVARGGSN